MANLTGTAQSFPTDTSIVDTTKSVPLGTRAYGKTGDEDAARRLITEGNALLQRIK